jgi:heptosyltransferase-1
MRILLVKTSSLGDVVHNCPAASDIARQVPGAEIDWAVEEPFAGIVRLHASVRRAIPVAVRRWRSALWNPAVWSEIGAFRRALAQGGYEHVIDTQGLLKSALLCACAPGTRHGMDRASAREPVAARFYDMHHAVPRERHAVERNRLLCAAALGYAAQGPCDYGLRAQGAPPVDLRAPYAVLLTMTSRAGKLWPEERWAELARALVERGVQPVLPWGDRAERARCERLAARVPGALVPRRLSLEELARLLRGARGVAGVDTGLTHFAAALGAATVGIYCATDPDRTGLHGSARATNLGGPGAAPATARVLAALEERL